MIRSYGSGGEVTSEELQGGILLANFAVTQESERKPQQARLRATLLDGLLRMRKRAVEPVGLVRGLVDQAGAAAQEDKNPKQFMSQALTTLIRIVSHYLKEIREEGLVDKVLAQKWINALSDRSELFFSQDKVAFARETRLHGVGDSLQLQRLESGDVVAKPEVSRSDLHLAFISADGRDIFLQAIYRNDLAKAKNVLMQRRTNLLAAVSKALSEERYAKILEPRKSLIINKSKEVFQEAKKPSTL
jgi:hypothetical protein